VGYTVHQNIESKRGPEFQIFSENHGPSEPNQFDQFNQVFQDSFENSINSYEHTSANSKCLSEETDISMETDHDEVMVVEDVPNSTNDTDLKMKLIDEPDICTSTQYGNDIIYHMLEQEKSYQASPKYMSKQEDLTDNMRVILVDWLAEVSGEYNITEQTHHLAVNYTDRFLSKIRVKRAKLQLVGVTALYIAAKLEEIYPPELNEFVYVTDDTYTKSQMLKMEQLMMKTLEFRLQPPTSIEFLHIFNFEMYKNEKLKNQKLFNMSLFLCDLMTTSSKMIGELNSRKACAAMLYSLNSLSEEMHDIEKWRKQILSVSGIEFDQSMQTLLENLNACHKEMVENSEQRTVMEKFSQSKFDFVAEIDPISNWNCEQ